MVTNRVVDIKCFHFIDNDDNIIIIYYYYYLVLLFCPFKIISCTLRNVVLVRLVVTTLPLYPSYFNYNPVYITISFADIHTG